MAGQTLVYSEIPMRTWRWLGVNEARVPESVMAAAPVEKHIVVPPGETAACVVVYREEAAAFIRASVAEGATLHLIRVQLAPDDRARADRVEADVAAGAVFRFTAVEAGGALSASSLDIALSGRGSKADVAALYFVDGTRRTDMNYIVRQKAPETDSAMRICGALAGKAEKVFRGTLAFVSGAAGSVGRESEEVILLSPKVRNRSVPLMLSGEADVDGHHAVTVGKMDENKLFYLMSRGLDGEEAKKLVVEAALAPVLSRLSDEALAEEIRAAIEGRLSHA